MKIKWPWGRKSTRPDRPDSQADSRSDSRGAREGRNSRPGEPDPDADSQVERGWHGSSVDLQDGLKVVEDADVTVPSELGPPERRREHGRR
jgi:hypothetical protein